MSMLHSSHLAVLLSAIIQWFIGVIWYSPALFGKAWHAAVDDRTGAKKTNEIAGTLATGVGNVYERRPFKLYVINAGYWLVALMVSGAVLGRLR